MSFTEDSLSLLTSGDDLHIHLTNLETGQRTQTFISHTDMISSIDSHPGSGVFCTSSLDGTVKIWDRS